jgi:Fe-S cluster assembly iron-binding protein IscA
MQLTVRVRVTGSGCRGLGFKFRVQGLGFRV